MSGYTIDILVLGGYLVLSFAIGIFANKILKNNAGNEDGFFLAGRNMPGWLTGISNAVTSMNADVAPAYIGVALACGLPVCWFYFSRFSIGFLLAGLLFFARWRQLGVATGPEFFALRFGGRVGTFVRGYSSVSSVLLGCVPWTGAGLLGIHLIFSNFFGYTEKWQTLVIILPLLLVYVWISGYAGVLITDFLQTLVIVIASIAICVVVLIHFGGPSGIAEGIAKSMPEQKDALLAIWPQPGNPVISPLLVLFWMLLCSAGMGGSVGIEGQRVISCRNTAEAVKVSIWSQLTLFLMLMLLTLPALGLLIDFPELHTADPSVREGGYGLLIQTYLPSGMKGLTLAALAAAVMSTISSHLSYGAQTLVNDVLHPLTGLKKEHGVWAGRLVMIGIMLLSVLVVYFSDSLIGLAITLIGVFASSALIGWAVWWFYRISFISWLTAAVCGPVIYFSMRGLLPLWGWWQAQLDMSATHAQAMNLVLAVGCMLLNTIIVLIVTFLTPPEKEEVLVAFYQKARPMGYWKPIQKVLAERGELRHEPKFLILGGLLTTVVGAIWIDSLIMMLSELYVGAWWKSALFGAVFILLSWLFAKLFRWQLKRLQ